MIRRLRRRHRIASLALLLGSLSGLGLALAAAPKRTLLSELAQADRQLDIATTADSTLLFVRGSDGLANTVLSLDREGRTLEALSSTGPLAPDLLVYSSATANGGQLPADARLVGTLSELRRGPRELALGAEHLYVFSLGHGVLIEHFDLSD